MPRNNVPGSTLRNRNRITNKSRLRIVFAQLESDLVLGDDEDDKNRLLQQTAGVDAEDANEHHLQAVLSAASQRHARKPGAEKDKKPATAYIPTPEAQGVADDWQSLYPTNVWKDPVSYVCSSTTAEEAVTNALAGDFTYYMDERDKEWLDKNNEEARGEGTSAQGALSPGLTRTSSRSAKAKGKDPEASQPVVISEDDFELVMGIFEKVTHEKTEFLHHSLETGMTFPAFSDYHDTFANDLPPTMFASLIKPEWVPKPHILLRISQIIYLHWKERRMERQGHRIIPVLNFDESDTLNESYICFRRREIKSVRKTRASQVSTSDKLARLQSEMAFPLKLAQLVIQREKTKKDFAKESQQVWEKRLAMVDLKRKFPSLTDKMDEELLIDKERPVKKSDTLRQAGGIKLKQPRDDSVAPRPEMVEKPKDRVAKLNAKIEAALATHKERNAHWEDPENIYQPKLVPPPQRVFKYYEPPSADQDAIAIRARRGRGGRFVFDRRLCTPRPIVDGGRRLKVFDRQEQAPEDSKMDVDTDSDVFKAEREEQRQKILSRWKFDQDDMPLVPPAGVDELDRVLVDEYDSKYMRYSMGLLGENDQGQLSTDPHIYSTSPEGRSVATATLRLGVQPPGLAYVRQNNQVRGYQQPQVQISQVGQANGAVGMALKKPLPPAAQGTMRISGPLPGNMRNISSLAQQQIMGAPATLNSQQASPPSSVSGQSQTSPPPKALPLSNGVTRTTSVPATQPDGVRLATASNEALAPASQPNGIVQSNSPPRPKSQNQNQGQSANGVPNSVPNGYHVPNTNGYPSQPMANQPQVHPYAATAAGQAPTANNGTPYNIHSTGLSQTQVQNLKSAFAASPGQPQDASGRAVPAGYMQILANNGYQLGGNATSMNLKLPQTRQMQWAAAQGQGQQQQRPPSVNGNANGVDVNGNSNGVPARTPSRDAVRRIAPNGQLAAPNNGARPQSSPSPIPSHAQSPPRPPATPTMQQQQSIPPSQNGF